MKEFYKELGSSHKKFGTASIRRNPSLKEWQEVINNADRYNNSRKNFVTIKFIYLKHKDSLLVWSNFTIHHGDVSLKFSPQEKYDVYKNITSKQINYDVTPVYGLIGYINIDYKNKKKTISNIDLALSDIVSDEDQSEIIQYEKTLIKEILKRIESKTKGIESLSPKKVSTNTIRKFRSMGKGG